MSGPAVDLNIAQALCRYPGMQGQPVRLMTTIRLCDLPHRRFAHTFVTWLAYESGEHTEKEPWSALARPWRS